MENAGETRLNPFSVNYLAGFWLFRVQRCGRCEYRAKCARTGLLRAALAPVHTRLRLIGKDLIKPIRFLHQDVAQLQRLVEQHGL